MRKIISLLTFIATSSTVFAGEKLIFEGKFHAHKKWNSFSKNSELNLKNILVKLSKSKSGRKLITLAHQKAKRDNLTLYDVIHSGKGSLTDTTLIRKFSPTNPNEISYESKSKVFINKELNQYDALMDLAHELTHFVYRENFNPYERNFTLSEFIKNTIEGKGGEVQAFMMECKVHFELFPQKNSNRYNCQKILDVDSNKLSYTKAVEKFYQVGDYFDSFETVLRRHGIRDKFPYVKGAKVTFVSSAYGIPYPVAAFEEYLAVLNKVCENDKRRISYMKKSTGRAPASTGGNKALLKLEKSYKQRCKETFN